MENKEKMQIMIIDDSITNLNIARTALEEQYEVLLIPTGEKALKLFERITPNLILLDVDMPGMNGFEVIQQIKQSPYPVRNVPVIFLTAMNDSESEYDGLNLGAVDYIRKPFSFPLLLKRVELHLQLQHYSKHLEKMVEEKTKVISELQYAIVHVMSDMVERRDGSTGQHLLRTQKYLKILLTEVKKQNIYIEELENIEEELFIHASQLHDIGKISIPDRILLKPGKLSAEEFEVMKKHTTLGEEAIRCAMAGVQERSFLKIAANFAGTHHERWDGTGYPCALKGQAIPIEGRLMSIVDVYDALITKRPYKDALSHNTATHIIFEECGTHFDPITISRMRLGNKPLMFVTDIDSHLPAKLVGDEVRMKQILLNMLINAIKYTKEGYISLRVSGTVENNQANLCFLVKDSGVGIKQKDLDGLFEEFERVNTTKNRSIEGTGLGLAISKKLCEMMGG